MSLLSTSTLSSIETRLIKIEQKIEQVNLQIENAEKQIINAKQNNDEKEYDRWIQNETALRKEAEQIREEKLLLLKQQTSK
jgi:hypothetical protein